MICGGCFGRDPTCRECGGTGFVHCCDGPPKQPGLIHTSTPDCWCEPEEVEPGLWLHKQVN